MRKGCKMGGEDHVNEVAELIRQVLWKTLCFVDIYVYYQLLFLQHLWILLWMLSIRCLDIFKQEQATKLIWELIQVCLFFVFCVVFFFLMHTVKTLALLGPLLFLCYNSSGQHLTLSGPAVPELTLQSSKCKVGSLAR